LEYALSKWPENESFQFHRKFYFKLIIDEGWQEATEFCRRIDDEFD